MKINRPTTINWFIWRLTVTRVARVKYNAKYVEVVIEKVNLAIQSFLNKMWIKNGKNSIPPMIIIHLSIINITLHNRDRRHQQSYTCGQAAGAAALEIFIVRRVSGVPNRWSCELHIGDPEKGLRASRSIPLYNWCQVNPRREGFVLVC